MKELIASYCRELRLGSRLSEEYQKIEAMTHEEFLEKSLEIEIGHREVTRIYWLIKNANFDVIKTFENYDFSRVKLPVIAPIEVVRSGSFIQEKQNLILITTLEFSKWSSIFYDEKVTAALTDCLVHHSHLITFQGPSYRYQYSRINL